jgi:hypothetical protein
MLAMIRHQAAFDVLTHEVGHNWFPYIVGSDENNYGWIQEGFDMFINTFSEARWEPKGGNQNERADIYRAQLSGEGSTGLASFDAYGKPAGVLQMLRRDVLGPELFDKGMRAYFQRWAFKHPTAADFFRTMDDVAGQQLDWFWGEWLNYVEVEFDQAVDSVAQTPAGNQTQVAVVYGSRERGVQPLLVRFTFSDGTTQDFKYPAAVWRANSRRYTVAYTVPKAVTQIEIDPDHHLVDLNRSNNSWPGK